MPLLALTATLWLAAAPAAADPKVPYVMMDEYVVAKVPAVSALRTGGVATCIAVFLHDPVFKVGALGHVSASTTVGPSIDAMLRRMLAAGAGKLNITAQLIGGWDTSPIKEQAGFTSTSPKMLADIKAALRRHAVPIVREETLTVPHMSPPPGSRPAIRNLVMDMDTGHISDTTAPGQAQGSAETGGGGQRPLKPHPLSL